MITRHPFHPKELSIFCLTWWVQWSWSIMLLEIIETRQKLCYSFNLLIGMQNTVRAFAKIAATTSNMSKSNFTLCRTYRFFRRSAFFRVCRSSTLQSVYLFHFFLQQVWQWTLKKKQIPNLTSICQKRSLPVLYLYSIRIIHKISL